MHSAQTILWDSKHPPKHAPLPTTYSHHSHVIAAPPAKRITFYKSGDSQFGGVRMAIHKRSFKCFDALLDDLSQKVPLPFGVRVVTTPRGTHTIKHLEQLQDGGCYLCSDRRHVKPINMELAGKHQGAWHHHNRRPQRPEALPATPPGHMRIPYRPRRILLVKNSEPGMRRSIVLNRRSIRSLKAFLDEASEEMAFHVRKLYTAEGRRIDSVQSLMTCPGVLVCVGREAFSPMLINYIRKTSDEKLPGLTSRSPGLGPRTPGNGARSPATQGVRSPPHGAQSRASEYDEGNESKKNVNFGLETKKSIIHPRSDSSNRSTRFSMSSEKSFGIYSQGKPAIMNDDIEKRVLVNKDGTLSLEMRVRFHLQNDETIQWSTQIKKSPSLTTESCPLSQAQQHYLQQGQSESCSDPDSGSCEGVDISSQSLQCALGNHCPCCYHKEEQKFEMWENPAHSLKHAPIPPPLASNPPTMRRTCSSSSSSSCSSRRVIRCRAHHSKPPDGSGSEQSQLVQQEMCMTEEVEHRVELAPDGDTQVEVCKVSRCCSRTELVAMDTSLRPLSGKSVEGDLMTGEDDNRSLSAVSSSSRVLQSLKEDQDDEDLPPSASQCCHREEPSPSPTPQQNENTSVVSAKMGNSTKSRSHIENGDKRSGAGSAASSCHCGAASPLPKVGADEVERSSTSNRSQSRTPKLEEVAAVKEEEVMRPGSGRSSNTRLSASSHKSSEPSVCPHCGGCKRGVGYNSNNRASKMSDRTCSPPESPSPDKESENDGHDREEGSLSPSSAKSNKSHRSDCHNISSAASGKEKERSPSALSSQSNLSRKSHKSKCSSEAAIVLPRDEAEGENITERPFSSVSNKSGQEITDKKEEQEVQERTASVRSWKSNLSDRSHGSSKYSVPAQSKIDKDVEQRATSQMSGKLSIKSTKSSKCTDIEKMSSPTLNVGKEPEESQALEAEAQQRPESGMSDKSGSSLSCKSASSAKTHHSKAEVDRSHSATSVRSHTSTKSKRSNHSATDLNDAEVPSVEINPEEKEMEEHLENQSLKSGISNKNLSSSNIVTIKTPEEVDFEEKISKERPASNLSGKSSVSSAFSHKSNHKSPAEISVVETPDAGEHVDNSAPKSTSSHGQTLSPRRTASRSHSPKDQDLSSRRSWSPAQQSLPNPNAGETRGTSALSVLSISSTKSGRSKCCCSAASKQEKTQKEDGETDNGISEVFEQAVSTVSTSPKRLRKGSGSTAQPLSRTSSGSVSLGLPEDHDTADSDSGKSNASFHSNNDRKVKSRSRTVPKNSEGVGRAGSTVSQKSNGNNRISNSSHNPSGVDIPTIEVPREGGYGEEQEAERPSSKVTIKSNQSKKSCCSCDAKAADRTPETESVKSISTTSKKDTKTSASISGSAKVRNKSPASASEKQDQDSRPNSEARSSTVNSQSSCSRRPQTAASMQSESKDAPKQSKEKKDGVKSDDLITIKSHNTKSEDGSINKSSSHGKDIHGKSSSPCPLHNSRPGSKVDAGSESTLSKSLSAADLLKESMATARQHRQPSESSRSKPRSETSERCPSRRDSKDPDGMLELTPACLPNASPNEVVSDWLRSIPVDSSMLALSSELHYEEEDQTLQKIEETLGEETVKEEVSPEDERENGDNGVEEEHDKDGECQAAEGEKGPGPPSGDSKRASLSKNWQSSAAVMKVLLGSSLGRCRSLPEVSPVYGRKLSFSARGLLDCLAQLQLLEPAVNSSNQKERKQQYDEIMSILQSLWLTEPMDGGEKKAKGAPPEQATPPRSSSGVGMSSGSGGSAKDNGNQGGDQAAATQIEDEAPGKIIEEEEEEENIESRDKPKETPNKDTAEEPAKNEEQSPDPDSLDSPKSNENPSSSDKNSTNDGSKSATDTEKETLDDSQSAPRPPLSKRQSQDPDPVWVLNLLSKLEKQFINHYSDAMAEFKVRWDLDDSLILDTMISELRDEVSRRIQNSIKREIKKIQGRAGRGGRSPRPPQLANLSRESTMTERRRRMLKVMKNQSVKTADSVSDEETAGEFSDQRSEDEYCPCDACVLKKMATRPFKKNPLAADAPVMMEFDLLKILQMKKTPLPAPVKALQPAEKDDESMAADQEGGNLEVVEEEEEYETKEDIKANVVLEETIPEEDEEEAEEETEKEMQQEEETSGQEETSEHAEDEDPAECTCHSAEDEEEAEEASTCTDNGEETGEGDTGENEGNTGTGEEEDDDDNETFKNATSCDEEPEDDSPTKNAENEESTLLEGGKEENVSTSAEAEDEDDGEDGTGEAESPEDGGDSEEQEEEVSEEDRASVKKSCVNPASCVTEGEEADAEDSDDSKQQSDTGAEESGRDEEDKEEDASEDLVEEFKPEEESEEQTCRKKKKDEALLHQMTKTSVESQPGSMEEVDIHQEIPVGNKRNPPPAKDGQESDDS
uniref:Doublecortin domain-containing protein n=1 Tax=Oryzias latipes TaxID=8090 RepID=A0A3P9I7R9_ORYLA